MHQPSSPLNNHNRHNFLSNLTRLAFLYYLFNSNDTHFELVFYSTLFYFILWIICLIAAIG